MLILLSPSKSMAFEDDIHYDTYSMPIFLQEANQLVDRLRNYSPEDIGQLMNVNEKLAKLNFDRFQHYDPNFKNNNSRQALLAYRGDVYDGIQVSKYSDEDMEFAQQTVRIISGLYGILRPLDLIQPYRLEMSAKLPNDRGNNLYDFWKQQLTNHLNQELAESQHEVVVNLASNEYFKALDHNQLVKPIITPVFKEEKNGSFKTIAIYAKKARGMMTDYIVRNRISNPESLKGFNQDGYLYNESMSTPDSFVFTR